MHKDRFRLFTIFCGILLASCQSLLPSPHVMSPVPKQPLHLYIVFSPVNKKAVESIRLFINNAKDNTIERTKIIEAGNSLTIASFCKGTEPAIIPTIFLQDQIAVDNAISALEASLKRWQDNYKNCDATEDSLVRISKNISDAAKNQKDSGKLVVLIHSPWSGEKISSNVSLTNRLENSMKEIAETGQLKRLTLFGIDSYSSDMSAKPFNAVSSVSSFRTDEQVVDELRLIRKNVLHAN
jgi:hypothetical protein